MPVLYESRIVGTENGRETIFTLAVQVVNSAFKRSIIQHEFPNSDGALLEDMGRKGDAFRVKCFFIDFQGGIPNVDRGMAFIDFIRNNSSEMTFVHPSRGSIPGRIEQVTIVNEDDRTNALEVDFVFFEEAIDPQPTAEADVVDKVEFDFGFCVDQNLNEHKNDLGKSFGAEGLDLANKILDDTLSLVAQSEGFGNALRDYMGEVDSLLAKFDTINGVIQNPANSLIAAINWGSNISGRIFKKLAETAERYSILYDSIAGSPKQYLDALNAGLDDLLNQFRGTALEKETTTTNARQIGLSASERYKEDEEKRDVLRRIESSRSFDDNGNLVQQETAPEGVLNIDELETSLSLVRAKVDDGVEAIDDQEGMKAIALDLLNHVEKTKVEATKIVSVTVNEKTPLHLIVVGQGLNYNVADRIVALNDIKNPTFAEGDIRVYLP